MRKSVGLFCLLAAFTMLTSTNTMAQSGVTHSLEPLRVDGRYLKNPKGDIVTLHGWITNWQNMHQEFYQETVDYEAHFKAWKLTTDSILSKGWKVDYARLHFGYNNPRDFDGFVQRGEFEKTTLRMIDYLNSKGIYVLLMADVESGDFAEHPQRFVGDPWYQRLLRYWDYVSSHPRIKNNPGVMFELQNEPGNFMSSDGKLNDFRTLRAYYQSMVDLIRRNGCQQVIWVPGWHCQIYYAGYATFPIEGDNIGYAAHFYDWGWVDGEEVKRVWRELKAASNMAPVIITETSWDGQYGPFMGGTASGFGSSLKRELDEAGNVSWNLLSEGHPMASVGDSSFGPAIHNDPEGTYVVCHKWFEEYAKTKYTPIKSLVATQIELEEVHKTVYPGDVRPITLMASFQDGRRWNVAGDTEWTSSNESVLTVIKGNIHVKGEGKVTVSGTYTDGMGQVFKTQFDVTSSLFPLTTDGIVIHNGGYDEITHTFSEGHYRWDYGGDVLLFVGWTYQNTPALNWNQRGGLDFSAYKYLVVRMNNQTSFGTIELYDQLATTYDGFAKVYEQIDGRNEVVIDLHGYPNFDPSHVTSVGIGYGPVSIKEIFLSNDGVNPAGPYTMPTLVTADDMTMYYGDVPQLTYSVSGYGNVGTPKLTTTATSTSPVGTYDILIEGDAEGVTYKPGKLTVLPAPLTITADDIVMNPGTDVPELTLTYDGLKGSETPESAFSELPTVTTTATKDSPFGNYDITVSGGSAANYELAWHPGTLTIAPAASSSVPVTDYTSRVKTDTESWQAWGECSTDFAPAVTTADGRTAPMVERYEETVETVGRIMEQTVTGLEVGEYTVVLCANANYTEGRGFASDLQDGARDVVELYANDERQPMTAHIGTAVGNNGEYTFNSVRVTDGTLTIGMEAIKPGTNWHTLQIKQLALNKVYTLAESYAVALAEAEELLTQKMSDAARGALLETMGLEQSYANYYRLTGAIAQAKSSVGAMEYARIALDVMRDELLTATNVCTPQAKSDYLYYYEAVCRAYDEDWLTDYKATEIYNPYAGGGADSYWYLVGYMMSAWEYNMGNTFYMGGAPYNVSWCDPMEAPDKMGFNKPFIEYFLAEGGTTLEARTLKATMTDMEPGLYTVTVRVRLRTADNSNGAPHGVTLQVCDGTPVPVSGKRIDDTNDYQDYYTATGVVGDDGVLTIMFHVASDNNLCWMAFRDLWQDKGEISIVSAEDLTMAYGDKVPQLTYSVVGEELGGEPQLTTTATNTSPVGIYPITIEKGSVMRRAVEYVPGTLTVTEAPLSITAKSYTIEQGDLLPEFEATYSGFKNDETSDVLIKKPMISCEATSWSEPGEYEIMISNAEAENYEISYSKGTLTITPNIVNIADGDYYMKNVASGQFLVGANDWGTRASLGKHGIKVTIHNMENGRFIIDTHFANNETDHYLGEEGYIDSPVAEWIITEPAEGVYALSLDGTNYWGYDGTSTILTGALTDATQPNAQWQLMTRAEMEAALADATESNPVDATFYIQAADFSRNDPNIGGWQGGPAIGGWDSNKNAEKWDEAPFDVYQEVANLPNGYYMLSVQGYYRIGNDANDAALAAEQYAAGTPELNAYLYGNDAATPLKSIMADAKSGEAPEGNYCNTSIGYVPQGMDGASEFFSEGLYYNELVVKVTDGTLRLGVKKEVASHQDWTIFDNFELYYLGVDYTPKPILVTSIILNESGVELEEGETQELTAYAVPYNAGNRSVSWTSSDENIATVDATGKVTALKDGVAIITATANDGSGVTATCTVTVKAKVIAVTAITLDKATAELTEGETVTLIATVSPDNATDKTVVWSTSDATVATVEDGLVTAVSEGTATITATAGDKSATCEVTVEKKAPEIVYAEIETGDYYLRNMGSGKFFTGANDWGTRASLGEHGIRATIYQLENEKYLVDTHVSATEYYHYWGSNGYVDAEAAEWIITEPTKGVYAFTLDGTNYWGYDGGSTVIANNLTDATHKNAQWQLVTRAELENALCKATLNNGVDATFYIQGHSFNRNHNENAAWMGEPVLGGPESDMCAEKWNTTPLDIYQELAGVPNGYYVVEVQGFYRDHVDPCVTAEHRAAGTEQLRASLYAGEYSVALKSILDGATAEQLDGGIQTSYGWVPNSMHETSSYFNQGYYTNKLDVWVTDGTLRLGIRKEAGEEGDWVIFDNFRLIYYGSKAPAGIEQLTIDNSQLTIYDLTGRKVTDTESLKGGIYIVNGRKVVVK